MEYKLSEHYYQPEIQELIEGETTPLRISQKYLDYAGNREPNIDWAYIPEMVRMIERSGVYNWYRDEALGHLRDAANEALSERRRMHHFDHAGSRVWEGLKVSYSLGPIMTLFVRAGGK